MDLNSLYLAIVAFGAALVNGAIGYGFSSTIAPIAVLWYSNKVLNPALVIVEVAVNAVLLYRERGLIRATWSRARPLISTMLPGVLLGTIGLTYLAVNDVKIALYAAMFPLTLLQLWGIRRPIRNEKRGGLVVGSGIGFLYALTTISGPPLALFFRNQGLSKNEFRCAIAQVRAVESTLTLGMYLAFTQFLGAGLVSAPSLGLLPSLLLPVLIGIPLGTLLLQSISREFFNRIVMAVDGILVSYGMVRTLSLVGWINSTTGFLVLAVLVSVVGIFTFWAVRKLSILRATQEPEAVREPVEPLAKETS
ncbi:MAG TPA: sulfite exporter TauE/SafE family protein [Thermoplasmata archaeon]|nr:sulfite exporter TauE/SafE family protein [Thermoplasmata archaeon]